MEAVQDQPFETDVRLTTTRDDVIDIEAEGVNINILEKTFTQATTDPYATIDDASEQPSADCDNLDGESLETEILTRLDAIDAKLDRSKETIRARVLSGGEGEQFLQLLDSATLETGEVVEISIETDSRND